MFPVSRLHFLRRGIKYQFAEQKCYHSMDIARGCVILSLKMLITLQVFWY